MNLKTFRLSLLAASVTLLALAAPCPAAQSVPLKDVVATLEQGYRLLIDVQADFSQRASIASMKREERGAGELFMKKSADGPTMFRFDYSKPRQQIISNGKKVWYYLPDNRQVMVTEMSAFFESGNSIALNYLTGMGNVTRDFTIRFVGDGRDKKGDYVVELIPKKPTPAMDKLHLTLSARAVEQFRQNGEARDPFPIKTSVLFDRLGNTTTIEFSKVKVNRGLAGDRFNFKIPHGVEVIKQ
jgi:outer membrane lipoprotein carrier protein